MPILVKVGTIAHTGGKEGKTNPIREYALEGLEGVVTISDALISAGYPRQNVKGFTRTIVRLNGQPSDIDSVVKDGDIILLTPVERRK